MDVLVALLMCGPDTAHGLLRTGKKFGFASKLPLLWPQAAQAPCHVHLEAVHQRPDSLITSLFAALLWQKERQEVPGNIWHGRRQGSGAGLFLLPAASELGYSWRHGQDLPGVSGPRMATVTMTTLDIARI